MNRIKSLIGGLCLMLVAATCFAQDSKLFSSTTIYFDPTVSIINAAEMPKLESLMAKIGTTKLSKIKVQSNTDSVGDVEENNRLSAARSASVISYLKSKGIDEQLIEIQNNGELKPIADNGSDLGRRSNRCTVIELYVNNVKPIINTVNKSVSNTIRISGELRDDETDMPIADSMLLVFYNENPDTFYTDKQGKFEVTVPDTVKSVDFYVKDYFFAIVNTEKAATKDLKIKIPLKKAKVGNKIEFYTVNFRGGSAVMLTGSYKVLDKIVRFMKYNPNREIEIAGHVNVPNVGPIPESSWDFELSVNRAKRVYQYLIENGIKENRLQYKGYGNWQMLFPKTMLEEEMVFNRRVEVKVTK